MKHKARFVTWLEFCGNLLATFGTWTLPGPKTYLPVSEPILLASINVSPQTLVEHGWQWFWLRMDEKKGFLQLWLWSRLVGWPCCISMKVTRSVLIHTRENWQNHFCSNSNPKQQRTHLLDSICLNLIDCTVLLGIHMYYIWAAQIMFLESLGSVGQFVEEIVSAWSRI